MTASNHETNAPGTYGFDDLPIGQVFQGASRTLSETDLMMFAMLTGDRHGIHTDEKFAKSVKLKGRIFHGTYGIALTMALYRLIKKLPEPVGVEESGGPLPAKAGAAFAWLMGFAVAIWVLGFYLAALVFVFLYMFYAGQIKFFTALGYAVAASLSVYVLFAVILKAELYPGLLGDLVGG